MDRETVELYEREAATYDEARRAVRDPIPARAFARRVVRGRLRIDLGCGPGLLTGDLGRPVVALDAAHAMVRRALASNLHALGVQGDLESLPFRDRSLAGAWARMSYLHVPRARLPNALGDLHRALAVGAPIAVTVGAGQVGDGLVFPDDDFPGRFFAGWSREEVNDILVGAGFDGIDLAEGRLLEARARRARTIADTVGPGLRVLMCGLNPSLHAADAGVGYVGPGNRFWRAATEAGLVVRQRDARGALAGGVGMTDLVKRATTRAGEVRREEFRAGAGRVERLVAWLRPRVVCFVGLQGYRVAVDSKAAPGWQDRAFGGVATYVMPSTSGLNAGTSYDDLLGHFRAVADAAGAAPR